MRAIEKIYNVVMYTSNREDLCAYLPNHYSVTQEVTRGQVLRYDWSGTHLPHWTGEALVEVR